SWVYGRYALSYELRQDFDKAVFYFEKAILASQNDDKIKDYRNDIERVEMKREIAIKHSGS
ncbi:MAG TPA: hypothetical protein VIM64_15475, partial [Puia sp.]